jgi:PPK2 family polyphosphate:nucleotide phosphotransferase
MAKETSAAKAKSEYVTYATPRKKSSLEKVDPAFTAKLAKSQGEELLESLGEELNRLQELLFAAGTHSLLVVLQGMDTAGKDGAIRHVMKYFNPQGCRVESFKAPTSEELAHDFLWRVHKVTPARGQVTVFNRSHYEDIVAVRVQKLAGREVWEKRYQRINEFESLLIENNTLIVKFFLHISKEEQEERLLEREAETEKEWKLNVGDWEQRKLWSAYQQAYEDVFHRCSTPAAPWLIVPADKKWFRNLAIARTLVDTLSAHERDWERVLTAESKTKLAELKKFRELKTKS